MRWPEPCYNRGEACTFEVLALEEDEAGDDEGREEEAEEAESLTQKDSSAGAT